METLLDGLVRSGVEGVVSRPDVLDGETLTDPLKGEDNADRKKRKASSNPLVEGLQRAMSAGTRGVKEKRPYTSENPMFDVDGSDVVVNTMEDAGNGQCEFVLNALLEEADAAKSTSLVEGDDGALVGFLHLPEDDETYARRPKRSQETRHKDTRKIVGAALRGFFEQIQMSGDVKAGQPMRILMTAFQAWDYVKDNPSGDFVKHQENTTSAMQAAFGDHLQLEQTKVTTDDSGNIQMSYVVESPDGGEQVVEVYLRLLPVNDHAIDPKSEGSIPALMKDIDPHAAISMGVAADRRENTRSHTIETKANDYNEYIDTRTRRTSALEEGVRLGRGLMDAEKR